MQEMEKGRELRYRAETEDVFKAILQKKLFNLKLLWRAEQITLPGIEILMDFYRWEREPGACPFIEPPTAAEIALMQRFLLTYDCDLGRHGRGLSVFSFRDFEDGEDNEAEDEMPEWFRYYDTYLGTAHLLLLPNIRGQKEEHYRELHFQEFRKELAEKEAANPRPPASTLPHLPFYDLGHQYKLSKLVDDEIFQELFRYEMEITADKNQAEEAAGVYDIEDIVYQLDNIPDPPPVRGGLSWREALYYCYQDYLKKVVAEDLPLVWEEDKFYRETGIGARKELPPDDGLSDLVKDQILRGRELAGEPRDFNF